MNIPQASVALLALLVAGPAAAQSAPDLPDDIFDDIDTPEESASMERASLMADEPEVELPDEPRKRRVIQTLQRKNFMKIGRYELSPHIGFVTNDPFINRYLFGTGLAYHVTEVFAVEVQGSFSPDFGESDWKPVTEQIITENQVTPDISKIQFFVNGSFQFSPIYGKVAVGAGRIINFDVFGVFGTGVVNTVDDLIALQQEDNPVAQATQVQYHPTLNFGGGVRVVFTETFAIRAEGRGLSYIEVLEGTTLEMKNNFSLLASVSLFFPGMK